MALARHPALCAFTEPSGSTATVTEGGLGGDDVTVNGTIVDQGGSGVTAVVLANTQVVPTISEWSLLLLLGFVGVPRSARVWATKR